LLRENKQITESLKENQVSEIANVIKNLKNESHSIRGDYCGLKRSSLDGFLDRTKVLREDFKKMLGWPLVRSDEYTPKGKFEDIGEDEMGTVQRLNIDVGHGLTVAGLLFIPKHIKKAGLVIAQHGGLGTPELISGFYGETDNYNDMVSRIRKKDVIVFAPQLLLWDENNYGITYDRIEADKELKQLGSSITAIEIYKLIKSISLLITLENVEQDKIAMIGLSYGGFYTLFTAAIDTRIKAALSSCFINDRLKYNWPDWTWFNSANTFLDYEIASLILPRAFYAEIATDDELFDFKDGRKVLDKICILYDSFGLKNFKAGCFNGVHEFCKNDGGIDFVIEHLNK
jgi:hypothetical protein